jgi:hypothetical protein
VLNIRSKTNIGELRKALTSGKDRKGINTVMIVYDNKRAVITRKEIEGKNFKALDTLFK